MTPMSAAEWQAAMEKSACAAFADHVLERPKEGVWVVRNPNTIVRYVEIVLLGFGDRVLVHGDQALVAFQLSCRPSERLECMANSHLDYLVRKVVGMSPGKRPRMRIREVALHQVREALEDDRFEEEPLLDAIDRLERDDRIKAVADRLCESVSDSWEWACDLGRVISSDVIFAVEACRTAWRLERKACPSP